MVVELRVVPLPNPLTVERFTIYLVTLVGLDPLVQVTVREVMFTVHVDETVVGTTARVAVVTLEVHTLELPLIIEFTCP